MNSFRKHFELAANIAIIVVAVLLCVVLVKNQFASSPTLNANDDYPNLNRKVGKEKISLPGVDWQKDGQTLVLALSTACHYCSESATFYRRLKQEGGTTYLVAVFSQPLSEGEDYLKRLAVPVDEVRQVPLESLNVRGTPTLVLVDNNGVVKDSWVGKLPTNQEAQVLARLKQE